jgi:processive 1,2-diacylglycerol beta-glucosyltransferase
MITIFDNETGARIGQITEAELRFLFDHLEEESLEDRDYYIMGATVDLLESKGADAKLVKLLRNAIGDRDGVEIRWQRG